MSIGNELNGTYDGTLDIKLDGTPIANDAPEKIYITKTGENKIKMELKDFSLGELKLGDIVVDNIAVVKSSDTNNAFAGSQDDMKLAVGLCDVNVDGTIIGDKIEMIIGVNVDSGGLKMVVAVDFSGVKMSAK